MQSLTEVTESPGLRVRLLVTSYRDPSDRAVSALRWRGTAAYPRFQGWSVGALTKGEVRRSDLENGVRVHSVARRLAVGRP